MKTTHIGDTLMIKDSRGHPVTVGSTVVFRMPTGHRRRGGMMTGIVDSLTPKGIRIWVDGTEPEDENFKTVSRLPDQFVVVKGLPYVEGAPR